MRLSSDFVFLGIQCVDEAQGSSEEPAFVPPRLLSGSEMKTMLQWEESESHPIPALEKLITVLVMHICKGFLFFSRAALVFNFLCACVCVCV